MDVSALLYVYVTSLMFCHLMSYALLEEWAKNLIFLKFWPYLIPEFELNQISNPWPQWRLYSFVIQSLEKGHQPNPNFPLEFQWIFVVCFSSARNPLWIMWINILILKSFTEMTRQNGFFLPYQKNNWFYDEWRLQSSAGAQNPAKILLYCFQHIFR